MSNLSNTRNNMDLIYQSFYRIYHLNNFVNTHNEANPHMGDSFQIWMNERLMSELKSCIQRDWVDITLDPDAPSIKYTPIDGAPADIEKGELFGDHMTMEDWINCVKSGGFVDSDGDGVLATSLHETNISISPSFVTLLELSMPDWATHVVWFNK